MTPLSQSTRRSTLAQPIVYRMAYRLGLRLLQYPFIRKAYDDHADLGGMGNRLIARMVTGLVIIAVSNAVCWPAIGIVTAISARTKHPMIAIIGAPAMYVVMFIICGFGMALAGGKGRAKMFMRWRARKWVEWLLSHAVNNSRTSGRNSNDEIQMTKQR